MRINTNILAALVAFLLTATLSAQREPRLVDTIDGLWLAEDSSEWSLDSSGALLYSDMVSSASASATSTIVVPGGIHALPSGKCLLCGRNAAGEAVLEVWQVTGMYTISLVSQRADASADYVGVVYDAPNSALYLLDATGSRLLKSVWNGQGGVDSLTFTVVATSTQIAELANAQASTLIVAPSGGLGVAAWPKVGSVTGYSVDLTGPVPTTAPLATAPSGHNAYAMPVHSSEGGSVVKVKAPLGVPFDVVRLSNSQVVGSGVGQGVGVLVTVTTSEPLVLGERYVARVQGTATPTQYSFECVRRYGVSETLTDGTSMRPFFFQLGATSGSVFNVQLMLNSPLRSQDTLYSGYLMVAFRAPTDPVIQVGSNYLLNTSFYVPVGAWVPANGTTGAFAVDVPIPAGLEGLVFLVQYWVVDGNEFKVSQVYGSAIE